MILQFLGAAHTVTGSCYLLSVGDYKILIDCGMFQGGKSLRDLNSAPFKFNPAEIDCMLLTHAHIDHSGLIPKLVKDGFKGPIYTTKGTFDLAKVMLVDSAFIQESDAEFRNRKGLRVGRTPIAPLYTVDDAQAALNFFVPIDYLSTFEPVSNVRVKLVDSGHILGSAIIELYVTENGEETKLVFTGDLGQPQQPLINDPSYIKTADYLIIESTYGDRYHQIVSDEQRENVLAEIINDTMNRGGNLIIPSFAVGRTQTILYYLYKLWKANKIDEVPVVVDSPLAVEATRIMAKDVQYLDKEVVDYVKEHGSLPKYELLKLCESAAESKALNEDQQPKIIISASGMADAGRVLHHLKHNLWRPESTVMFVGYQAEGCLGRRLLDGVKAVRILGEEIKVKARITSIEGFSAHADHKQIEQWLDHLTMEHAKQVFVVHGEPTSAKAVQEMIVERYDWNAYIPFIEDKAVISRDSCIIKEADVPQVNVQRDMEAFLADIDMDYRRFRKQLINYVIKNPETMPAALNMVNKGWRYIKRLFKDFGLY